MNWHLLRRYAPVATLAMGVLLSAGVGAAFADGRCITLEVEGRLLLPDGSLHEPGQLTLCRTMDFSPVSTLHKTYVNGRAVGMLRSRRVVNESDGSAVAVVHFRRDGAGQLTLTGYALPAGDQGLAYRFEAASRQDDWRAQHHPGTGGEPRAQTIVLAAATLDD